MTTTYDPFHPKYYDEVDLRQELVRVFDLCHGCRLCFKFCPSFPTMFDAIDRHDDQDSARLTNAEQDHVVDQCFNCKLCYVNCPYIPGQSEWELDFPRLMMRADQVLYRERRRSLRTKLTDTALASTDLVGRAGSALAPLVNAAIRTPDSPPRKLMEATAGIAAERVLPPYRRQRFTTWFREHVAARRAARGEPAARPQVAAVFPTCLVEYQDTQVGRDLVRVYEHN